MGDASGSQWLRHVAARALGQARGVQPRLYTPYESASEQASVQEPTETLRERTTQEAPAPDALPAPTAPQALRALPDATSPPHNASPPRRARMLSATPSAEVAAANGDRSADRADTGLTRDVAAPASGPLERGPARAEERPCAQPAVGRSLVLERAVSTMTPRVLAGAPAVSTAGPGRETDTEPGLGPRTAHLSLERMPTMAPMLADGARRGSDIPQAAAREAVPGTAREAPAQPMPQRPLLPSRPTLDARTSWAAPLTPAALSNPRLSAPPPAPEPSVTISIGRVDIEIGRPSEQPKKASRPAAPRLSLADYMSSRRGSDR